MPNFSPSLLGAAGLAIPFAFASGALLVSRRTPFRGATIAALAALLAALGLTVSWVLAGAPEQTITLVSGPLAAVGPSVRLDLVTSVMTGLITFIALIIVRFSARYLGREPGRERYARWLLATLAAVSLLVISGNLLWLGAAWVATSLALHQLLTFFQDRPQALLAAHKKFLVSRCADLCLLSAIGLISAAAGSLQLDEVHRWATTTPELPVSVTVATVLLVIGASLKCAQLPFHGWLTQVMEAPTPVSALLHAGVVNIGGFLMIRMAPLMMRAELAQTLLVAIGSTTVVAAALVMSRQVSAKVSLAWSTCAQMGFMLVQCGLGAYHLALLHLVAHSLYKAHAFLSTGSVVDGWRAASLAPRRDPASLGKWIGAALVGLLTVAGIGLGIGLTPASEPALFALGLVVALALTPLLVRGSGGPRLVLRAFGSAAAVALLYFGWHELFAHALPLVERATTASMVVRLVLVGAAFLTLFVLQAALEARPTGRLARALHPRLLAGFYLDELFTRATFRFWPPTLPERRPRAGRELLPSPRSTRKA